MFIFWLIHCNLKFVFHRHISYNVCKFRRKFLPRNFYFLFLIFLSKNVSHQMIFTYVGRASKAKFCKKFCIFDERDKHFGRKKVKHFATTSFICLDKLSWFWCSFINATANDLYSVR